MIESCLCYYKISLQIDLNTSQEHRLTVVKNQGGGTCQIKAIGVLEVEFLSKIWGAWVCKVQTSSIL